MHIDSCRYNSKISADSLRQLFGGGGGAKINSCVCNCILYPCISDPVSVDQGEILTREGVKGEEVEGVSKLPKSNNDCLIFETLTHLLFLI